MISGSLFITKTVDILIVLAALYLAVTLFKYRSSTKKLGLRVGVDLILIAVIVKAIFHSINFIALFIAPLFISDDITLGIMRGFHENWGCAEEIITILAIAGGLSYLLQVLIPKASSATENLEIEVRERTSDLHTINESLRQEISHRKQKEEALQLTQFSVDHSIDAAFWIGPDARFLYVNDQACRSLGYSRDELLMMSVHDIDPDFPQSVWSDHWKRIKQEGTIVLASRHQTKDGKIFPVEVSVNFLEFQGKEYSCAFTRDLTERKKSELALEQAQKLESLGVLTGGIAHDFNNLLVGILGNAVLALMELPSDSSIRKTIEGVERSALRASELINQLLAYSGKGVFDIGPLNLNSIIKEMAHLLNTAIAKKSVMIQELTPDLPMIQADASQIRQIIMNLITNASEALLNEEGFIIVSSGIIKADRDYLSTTYLRNDLSAGDYVYLQVEDSGYGIDPDTLSKIFDPFYNQVHWSRPGTCRRFGNCSSAQWSHQSGE